MIYPDRVTLIVKPTHQCNLDCYYCYDKKNRVDKETMGMDIVEKTIDIFKEVDNIQWIWHGGEPLLMGVDYFYEANDLVKSYKDNVIFDIQSNGTLIDNEIIDMFNKYKMRPGISFDGIRNELSRKSTGRLMHVYKLLKNKGLGVGALMVVAPDNIDNIIDEYEYFKRLDISPKMNPMFKAIGNEDSDNIATDKMIKYITEFFDYWITDTDHPTNNSLCEEYINRVLNGNRTVCNFSDCVGRWFSLHPSGDIYPCGRDWDEDICFGNIKDLDSLEDIYTSPVYIKYREDTKELLSKCSKCKFYYACHGGCYGNLYSSNSKELSKKDDEYCRSTKSILSHIYNRICDIDIMKVTKKTYNKHFLNLLVDLGYRNLEQVMEFDKYKESIFNGDDFELNL